MAVLPQAADSVAVPAITLDQALEIALSENVSVKVADLEVQRSAYAKKGAYAALFPQIEANAAYQRTIQKQKMYVDIPGMEDGMEVGRWNTWSAGASLAMPLVNAQLWESLKISGQSVELAVEKARDSRLSMVTEVKSAYYAVLLAKEVKQVYARVYENAEANLKQVQMRYNAQKASELELVRAKANLAGAIPNKNDSETAVSLALWQLKAVMGVSLDEEIDVVGSLDDYAGQMLRDISAADTLSLSGNSSLKQLELQSEQLASNIKAQQYAYIPTLSLGLNYSINAIDNTFDFSEYKWSPYSYVGLTLRIPIFSGGKRYADIKQTRIQKAELELSRLDTERQLRILVRSCLKTMETNMRTYHAAQDAVTTAQKAYDIATQSFNVGRSTITDLNDAQLVLVQSELNVTQALYSFLVAKAQLEQTLGYDFTQK